MRLLYALNPTRGDLVATGADSARSARHYGGEVEPCDSVVYFKGEFDPSAYEAAGVKCEQVYRPGTKRKTTRKKVTGK